MRAEGLNTVTLWTGNGFRVDRSHSLLELEQLTDRRS